MKTFITFDEFAEINVVSKIDESHFKAADDGILDILDITDKDKVLRYGGDGEWFEMGKD